MKQLIVIIISLVILVAGICSAIDNVSGCIQNEIHECVDHMTYYGGGTEENPAYYWNGRSINFSCEVCGESAVVYGDDLQVEVLRSYKKFQCDDMIVTYEKWTATYKGKEFTIYSYYCDNDPNPAPVPHTPKVVIKGTPATCTEGGYLDEIWCEYCCEILQKRAEIKATGHSYVLKSEDEAHKYYKCSSCGKEKMEYK